MRLQIRWAVVFLLMVLAVGAFGCRSGPDTADPAEGEGTVEFTSPEQVPQEVDTWIEEIEEASNEMTDWMRYNDEIYVAVARGESPNPGHGVEIDEISYWHCPDEGLRIDVSATYTVPDPDEVYPQVVVYPVAVANFALEDLPQVDLAEMDFRFDIDDSEVAKLQDKTHPVVLFFGTDDGQMTRTYRQVQADELTPDILAGELMSGPLPEEGYQPLLPEDTALSIELDDEEEGLAIVDFTPEIHGVSGSLGEQLALYSVVNSVVENFEDIDRVQIKVDGEETESLGHVDLRSPLSFDGSLIFEDK